MKIGCLVTFLQGIKIINGKGIQLQWKILKLEEVISPLFPFIRGPNQKPLSLCHFFSGLWTFVPVSRNIQVRNSLTTITTKSVSIFSIILRRHRMSVISVESFAHLPNIRHFKELWLMAMFMTWKTIYSQRLKIFFDLKCANINYFIKTCVVKIRVDWQGRGFFGWKAYGKSRTDLEWC